MFAAAQREQAKREQAKRASIYSDQIRTLINYWIVNFFIILFVLLNEENWDKLYTNTACPNYVESNALPD